MFTVPAVLIFKVEFSAICFYFSLGKAQMEAILFFLEDPGSSSSSAILFNLKTGAALLENLLTVASVMVTLNCL